MTKRAESPHLDDLDAIREDVRKWWQSLTREVLIQDHGYDPAEVDTLEEATAMIMTCEVKDWYFTLEEMRDCWKWDALNPDNQ